MKKEKNNVKKAGVIRGAVLGTAGCVFVAFMLLTMNAGNVVVDMVDVPVRVLKPVNLGDANPAANETFVAYVMSYPHQADPGTAYASNLSNATAYEFYDGTDSEMTGETPYDTTFDLVVKIGVNATHGWNSTGSTWEMGWINATLTCADLSISQDTACSEQQINAGDDWNYVHYYLDNSGSGYTRSHGETFNVTSFEFWSNF